MGIPGHDFISESLKNLKHLKNFWFEKLLGHRGCVQSSAWNPEGSKIVSGSWDNTLIIWNAQTGEAEKLSLIHI